MLERLRARARAFANRLRRLERRELDAFLRWIERTGSLLHFSVVVFVPLLIAAVTWLSNATAAVSFLLFPPLASGTYTLFADPEGRYSTPGKFVGGMTVGALCGWLAVASVATAGDGVSATGAALGVFLTGTATWALDLEEPTAFSTALLVLVTGNAQLAYVLGIAVSSSFVAAAFVVWRDRVYEARAQYLYQTTQGDDHVLVPVGGPDAEPVARFAAALAGAHEAGKVVLFDVVSEASERRDGDPVESGDPGQADAAPLERADDAVRTAESLAADLEAAYDVPCEVVVAAGDRGSSGLVLRTARENNCDLIVAPYAESDRGGLSAFITGLFDSEIDVIAFRSSDGRSRWRRSLVAVRGAGDTARAMVDFALRIADSRRPVSVSTCIDHESHRRSAETTLADLVDAFSGPFETHVVTEPVEDYLSRVASRYDVVFIGSSTDRSTASRFVSPPTFRKLGDLESDVAIVHRGRRR
ncbi:HPP family protein [Natronococcus sp. JC468]|uniref:universal stress protein n=1 Tax=Natronococcus sp. JC468 TaxID=1961921 RepID=UPI00143C3AE9|nr:HPP family protein [Natronococcus sp. JC468]NKE34315.1 HPP family protein [Natronococcus sp. JC468]